MKNERSEKSDRPEQSDPNDPTRNIQCAFLPLLCLAYLSLSRAEDSAPKGHIVKNGGFEKVDPKDATRPVSWDPPDGLGVQWLDAPKGKDGGKNGKAMRLDTSITEKKLVEQWKKKGITKWDIPKPSNGAVAATYGLSYYSAPFPIEKGQAYRVLFDFHGKGGAKLWVRGYGEIKGQMRRRYEAVVHCRTKGKEWTHFSQVFHPTKHRPRVTEMKVMLYAYWPPGIYWFDNVRIIPVTNEEYERDR
ncbi:MAG: hypothetical protein QF473_01235 [Planctomycetota bacterium]|jgi:hypothetical protein|nr:hypothetical protein [Planctomycetota bacterium]